MYDISIAQPGYHTILLKKYRHRKMLKKCSEEDIAKLLAYMTTWKIAETQELQQKILRIKK